MLSVSFAFSMCIILFASKHEKAEFRFSASLRWFLHSCYTSHGAWNLRKTFFIWSHEERMKRQDEETMTISTALSCEATASKRSGWLYWSWLCCVSTASPISSLWWWLWNIERFSSRWWRTRKADSNYFSTAAHYLIAKRFGRAREAHADGNSRPPNDDVDGTQKIFSSWSSSLHMF